MSFDYRYYYLSGSLYYLLVWSIIFWKLPRYRSQMVILGSAFWIGIVAEYFWWTRDWWHPATITGTRVGPESFILAFTHIGIPIFLYKFVFSKETEKNYRSKKELFFIMLRNFLPWFVISFSTTATLIYVLHMRSIPATFAGMLVSGLYIIIKRKDLMIPMVWSALLMASVALPFYWLAALFPGAIENTWNFTNMSGIMLLGAPLEDIVWYVLLGFFLGGAYEFLFEFKLKDSGAGTV